MPLVIFDLDNTLLDRTLPVRRWAREFVNRYGLDPNEVRWLLEADGDGEVPRPVFLSAARERYNLADSLDALQEQFRARIVALTQLDPGVPVALERLRRAGWRIAVATNGTVGQQVGKIRGTRLDGYVDAVAVSEEVGVAKPDRRLFEVAAERAGSRLAEGGWMVGDSPVADVGGGKAAGLRTVWVRRGRAWDLTMPVPDATVDDVVDVAELLTDW